MEGQPLVAQQPATAHGDNGADSHGVGDPADLAEFFDAVRPKGPRCTVATVLDLLPEERQARFLAAMALPKDRMPDTAIAQVVTGWLNGTARLGPPAVGRHRLGQCSCQS
jgi:hypothetical protein